MFPAIKVSVHASNLRGVFLILMYDVFIKLVGPENFSLPEGSKGLQGHKKCQQIHKQYTRFVAPTI